MYPQPMATEDLTTKLITSFKGLITDGALTPGCKLPPERELAARFGVSRPSLRQALKVLSAMGIVNQRVGDGTYLTRDASAILNEPIEFLMLIDDLSLYELLEARMIIEPELAARAAERATADDLAALQESIVKFQNAGKNLAAAVEADLEFHEAISKASGNRACFRVLSVIHQAMWKAFTLTLQTQEPKYPIAYHKAIYSAIFNRDPQTAREQMLEHLIQTRDGVLRANMGAVDPKLSEKIQPVIPDPRLSDEKLNTPSIPRVHRQRKRIAARV